jgi:hypothetical protein
MPTIYDNIKNHLTTGLNALLTGHYGFTQAEFDFIANYNIKYRMGKEL